MKDELLTAKTPKSKARKDTPAKETAESTVVPVKDTDTKSKKEKTKKSASDKSEANKGNNITVEVNPPAPAAQVTPESGKETRDIKAVSNANQSSTEVKKMETKQKQQVRYSDEDLEMFRERISDVRKEAIEELSMLKDRLEDLTNYDVAEESMIYSMHMAEQGSEFIEKEKTYAQIQRINEYIKKLDEAIQRINEKTYGICRVCGCLIARERLLAVPITTLSASYKIHKKCPEDGIDRIEPLK
jgi:RNA polymerase-binding transcription factor DksA